MSNSIRCGWASQSEHKSVNGTKGDQTGKEVKLGDWYSFGQEVVWRFKDRDLAERYANKIVDACRNDHIGYGQADRGTLYSRAKEVDFDLRKIKTNCNCDCSSLTACCLNAVGVKIDPYARTATLNGELKSTGKFTKLTGSDYTKTWKNLKVGDIINDPYHHVISVVGNCNGTNKTVKEHDDEKETVQIKDDKKITAENFDLGNVDINKLKYHVKNGYFTQDEMNDNARFVSAWLYQKYGWTINAISGILGNMCRESNINPGLWQSLKRNNMRGGYGLTQWTPASKYINWAKEKGYAYEKMESQLKRISWEVKNNKQWIKTSTYNFSFLEFTKKTDSPEYLSKAFVYCYERPGIVKEEERTKWARYYYDKLSNPKFWGKAYYKESSDNHTIDTVPLEEEETSDEQNDDGGYTGGETGKVYEDILKTPYNMKQLRDDEIDILKRLSYGDTVRIKHSWNKSKHYGYSAYGNKLTTYSRGYIIKSVKKNGYLIISPSQTTNYKIVVNPKYIEWRKQNDE